MALSIKKIRFAAIADAKVTLSMARLDSMHNLASGNKIYKLIPIIQYAKTNNIKQILSFGGTFSNHIHALALLAKQEGLASIGIIRGEVEYAQNPTLLDAKNAGMELVFVDRAEYKKRNDEDYLAKIQRQYPHAIIIAEGGSHPLAISGCQLIVAEINKYHHSDIFTVAAGTGATAAGMICGLKSKQHLRAYSVLKDASLNSRIKAFVTASHGNTNEEKYTLHAADFGAYAKFDKELLDFILDFLRQTGILLDPIYTSKMCKKLIEQIKAGEFNKTESITMIHSGGLQGWRGMRERVIALGGNQAWSAIEINL